MYDSHMIQESEQEKVDTERGASEVLRGILTVFSQLFDLDNIKTQNYIISSLLSA